MNIIELNNITKIYGKDNYKTVALNTVNLNVKKGEFLAIMGPSGSGKSTLLNIMGCMDVPSSGNYLLYGNNITNLSNKDLSNIRNTKLSFIFQNFALMNEYTVYDNVELPLSIRKMSSKKKKDLVDLYLGKLGILDQAKKKPSQLSGGQQQRVAIARALCSESDIILADEPTGALDQNTGKDLMALLRELNKQGKTIIVITHDPNVASYCDRTLYITDGFISDSLK